MLQPFLQKHLFKDQVHHLVGYGRELATRMPRQGRILDLGCGDNLALAPFRTTEREVWGVDFQQHPHLAHTAWFRLLPADGQIPFADNSFDLIHSMWVLEHVRDPGSYLTEVHRVLTPGGIFLAHTISGSHYVSWIRRLFGLLPHGFSQQLVRGLYGRACHDTFPAYYRLNTARQLELYGAKAHLPLVQLRRYVDAGYFSFLPPLRNLAILVDWLMTKVSPGFGHIYLTATLQKPFAETGKARQAA